MAELRSKLFLSYSKADTAWRDAFQRQLSAIFVSDELWIDGDAIPWGADWEREIQRAIGRARCALVLLTPAYLDTGHYARRELDLLLAQAPRLKVLPVLVEDCPWQTVEGLDRTQLVRWPGGVRLVGDGREDLAPLAESPHRDRSIIDICERARKEMGVVGQARPEQIDALFQTTQHALSGDVELQEAVHSGAFSVVYRATLHDEVVAVKAVPDAPRQNRIRQVVTEALPKVHKLTDPAFIRLRDSSIETEPHWFLMDYVDWPTVEQRLGTLPGHRVDPHDVAVVLAQVARAHHDAHRVGLLVGPLTLGSIHADDEWTVRLSPLRIEGVLARAASMSTGQMMNWDALTYLAPEVSAGHAQEGAERERLDALDQYYLGLLGLELLLGRPPCEVLCFDDLVIKARFFDDPRAFFDDGRGAALSWVDTSPALAYVLIRLLARAPEARAGSSESVARDLGAGRRQPAGMPAPPARRGPGPHHDARLHRRVLRAPLRRAARAGVALPGPRAPGPHAGRGAAGPAGVRSDVPAQLTLRAACRQARRLRHRHGRHPGVQLRIPRPGRRPVRQPGGACRGVARRAGPRPGRIAVAPAGHASR